jgi:putative ABC transport system ATP-binding protein
MSLIQLAQVTKSYGSGEARFHALHNVNLQIAQEELVAIMGPSGSGKSTLLHLMAGLDQPESGQVIFDGKVLNDAGDKTLAILRRQRIGFIFQFFNLIPVLTARENVAVPLILDGISRATALQRADEVLVAVGLAGRKHSLPAQLSGGQQQRVAIARALVIRPRLILADEPTGALDSETGQDIVRLLLQLVRQHQSTVVIVTHDPRVAAHANRIIHLKDGKVVDDSRLSQGKSVLQSEIAAAV